MQRATPSGPRSMTTPSASSTSAEPALEEAARPPCLQTGTPAPATTSAAMVEMLMVPLRSAPADDPPPLALGRPAPHALFLPVGQRPFQAGLLDGALHADGLGFLRLLVRDGIKDVGIYAATGRPLPPYQLLGVLGVHCALPI